MRNEDGTIVRVAPGTPGTNPVWSPDGASLLFEGTNPIGYEGCCVNACNADTYCTLLYGLYTVDAGGSNLRLLGGVTVRTGCARVRASRSHPSRTSATVPAANSTPTDHQSGWCDRQLRVEVGRRDNQHGRHDQSLVHHRWDVHRHADRDG